MRLARRTGRWAARLLVAAWAIGCGRGRDGESGPGGAPVVQATARAEEEAPPELVYVGCEAVRAGPVCMLRPDATLRVWLGVHPETPMLAEIDGVAIAATWVEAEDGLRLVLEPPVASGALTLRAEDAGWKIELGLAAAEALPAALVAVQAAIDQRDAEAAAKLLAAAMPGLEGAARAEGLKMQGDVAFVRGDLQAALAAYEPAFVAARDAGLLRRASEVALTASYVCTSVLYDLKGAREWLARHAELVPLLPEAKLRHGYYAGLVADFAGDLRGAQRGYEDHARAANALGLNAERAAGLMALGALRGRFGDTAGAERAFAEVLALGAAISIEVRALTLQNAAWVALEARTRGRPGQDPEPHFAAAAAIFGPEGAWPDPLLAAEMQINRVYALLVRGDVEAASIALAEAATPSRIQKRWRDFLAARLALLGGDAAAALRGMSAVQDAAAEAGDRGIEWRAIVGAGEALERLGRDDEALDRYRQAAAMHTGDLEALAFDTGREHFASGRDGGAQRLVTLLLRLGREDEALCTARRARGQGFAGLAAAVRDPGALVDYRAARAELDAQVEASWGLSRRAGERTRAALRAERRRLDSSLDAVLAGTPEQPDARSPAERRGWEGRRETAPAHIRKLYEETAICAGLRMPGAGELLLVYYPVEGGYVSFGRDASQLVVAPVMGALPEGPEARAELLLGPFAEAIRRARRVTVIASGALSAESFHALPWASGALVDAVVVAYSLDLSRPVGAKRSLSRAVQLAPASNLVGAADELEIAATGLQTRGVSVERLKGDEADLLARIAGADLLHYAGHAHGGSWSGALDLGGDRSLGPRDLLSVAAPRVAVLSGCETGLPDPQAHAGGMTLAHALLLAGAEAVLASDAVIEDSDGAAMGSAVVLAIADGRDPAEALAEVQRARATSGWARFRAFTP